MDSMNDRPEKPLGPLNRRPEKPVARLNPAQRRWHEENPKRAPIGPENLPGAGWYVASLVIPIIGVGLGFYAMTKNLIGPGLAMWAASFVGLLVGVYLQLASS